MKIHWKVPTVNIWMKMDYKMSAVLIGNSFPQNLGDQQFRLHVKEWIVQKICGRKVISWPIDYWQLILFLEMEISGKMSDTWDSSINNNDGYRTGVILFNSSLESNQFVHSRIMNVILPSFPFLYWPLSQVMKDVQVVVATTI